MLSHISHIFIFHVYNVKISDVHIKHKQSLKNEVNVLSKLTICNVNLFRKTRRFICQCLSMLICNQPTPCLSINTVDKITAWYIT